MAQPDNGLKMICNLLFNTDTKSTEYAGAVLLTSILSDEPELYERYIQQRGDNFLEIMEDDELLSQQIASEISGAVEENNNYDPIIYGESPAVVALREAQDIAVEETKEKYSTLMNFINYTRDNRDTLSRLIGQITPFIQQQIIMVLPIINSMRVSMYDNINLVSNAPAQIFPKFSLNIICEKEPLLQTTLLAGRENGMGKILNDFVFIQLKDFFKDFPDASLKIIEPTESNRLWQVKISIYKNDFIFFSIQIINVKKYYFNNSDKLLNNELNPVVVNNIKNLCFSLYNKANSKDFNCLCSLSDLDIFTFQQLKQQAEQEVYVNLLLQLINIFLTNLLDSQINIKKKYFILGLCNLIYCSNQSNYTIETKVYRWLFDQPIPAINVIQGQNNKNIFLYAMRLIQHVNILCREIGDEGQEKIRFVMGGGKQYSLFQKALNKFSITNEHIFNSPMERVVDTIINNPPIPITIPNIEYPNRENFITQLKHTNIKAAADADFGIYHKQGALGSTECMSVCMLLQVSLKKLIDFLIHDGETPYEDYEVNIGNSCIGNPPTTLSSLRMVLNNSSMFYNNLDGVDIYNNTAATLGIQRDRVDNFLKGIYSTISPFDLVQKGSMIDYIKHIIDAVMFFGNGKEEQISGLTELLSEYCMITEEGFSSPLKGIFDIFYTIFIIENFTNRTLVTQKINKELKRISICAQVLYLHYIELLPLVGEGIINNMLDILRHMISYGYSGDLLDKSQFDIIMSKYVEFIIKLIEFYDHQQRNLLLFYCVTPTPPNSRSLTRTERFFMNLLENSNHEPIVDRSYQPLPIPPLVRTEGVIPNIRYMIDGIRDNVFFSLYCIPGVITAIRTMDQNILTRLYQNKIYASYKDTKNKSNSVIVISIAYQSFLWNTAKRNFIKIGEENDEDKEKYYVDGIIDPNNTAIGLLDIFKNTPMFFNDLLISLAKCYDNENENLLDIYLERFDGIIIDNPIKFQFMFWFITCVFGIKSKSSVKKILSMARTYLNNIRETLPPRTPLFGCNIEFPAIPDPKPAPVELSNQSSNKSSNKSSMQASLQSSPRRKYSQISDSENILCIAYDPYTIDKAYILYRNLQENFRPKPQNYVFKINNMIGIRKDSEVLKRDVISRLTIAFSKLPRGQAFLNQSYHFMNSVLTQCIESLENILSQPRVIYIRTILGMISPIPNLLTENPYKPTAHDVSKFIDFKENPQFFRNKWIVYLITEILNSGDEGENLFNHMKLLVLLFRYLIILPTDEINDNVIQIQDGKRTSQTGILLATRLIKENYVCATQLPITEVSEQVVEEIQDAKNRIEETNKVINSNIATGAVCIKTKRNRSDIYTTIPATTSDNAAAAAAISTVPSNSRLSSRKKQGGSRIYNKVNNYTRKNKYNRNIKNRKNKENPKYKIKNKNSKSPSKSNKNKYKSKSKSLNKNITFKRRRI